MISDAREKASNSRCAAYFRKTDSGTSLLDAIRHASRWSIQNEILENKNAIRTKSTMKKKQERIQL